MTPIMITYDTDDGGVYAPPYGRIATSNTLGDVVMIGVQVVAQCAARRRKVCTFAPMLAGIAYVTHSGNMVIQNSTRVVVYELFPATWPEGNNHPHLYVGVKNYDGPHPTPEQEAAIDKGYNLIGDPYDTDL